MSNLQHRQSKIQDKRKTTAWRDFVMEICSWFPLGLQKNSGIISRYPDSSRISNIVPVKDFFQNRDSLLSIELNSYKSFLEQYEVLFRNCMKSSTYQLYGSNDNSDFTDGVFGTKNTYLSFVCGADVENICYSVETTTGSRNVFNSLYVLNNSTNIYMSRFIDNSFNIFYSQYITDCSDIRFSSNLIGCNHCIFCDNLNNQSYCIENNQYSKEEYFIKQTEFLLKKDVFSSNYENLSQKGNNYYSENIYGSSILYSNNINNGHGVYRTTNGSNLIFAYSVDKNNNNFYDGIDIGINCEDFYAVLCSGTNSNHLYCSMRCGKSSYMYYCENCEQCSFCLGCYGLINKSYCILNKQYSKEERYEKVDEIFAQMDADGTLGQFFPASMNPFYFNDTAAYLIDPSFTKEEVTAAGYLWRDKPIKVDIPANAEIVKVEELEKYEGWRHPEGNEGASIDRNGLDSSSFQSSEGQQRYIDPSIMKKIIQDEEGNVYRIVPMEYEFLMKHGLPLPRKHWLDRMKENFRIN